MGKGREFRSFTPTLVLLLLAVLINYVDRGNLALAAPLLKSEWGISATRLGVLFSAFFWTYMTLQFVVGSLVDRFNVNVVMALGLLVWSLSTAATGLTTGFATMLAMRLLLGVGESVMFPSASKLCAQHLPEHRRGFANALLIASIRWGSALGTFGGGLFMARYGWRNTFFALGLAGLLWLPAWQRWKPGPPTMPEKLVAGKPSIAAILRQPSFWGAAMGHCCANYLLYFLISWLPYYLIHERNLSMTSMAGTAGLLYAVDSFSAIAAGWIADRQNTPRRQSPSWCAERRWPWGLVSRLCHCLPAPIPVREPTGGACWPSGSAVVLQTLPPTPWDRLLQARARREGGLACRTGSPTFPVSLVRRLQVGSSTEPGSFDAALAVAALVAVAGGLAWLLGVRRQEPVQWAAVEKSLA